MTDAYITCAPASAFDELLRVLNSDDAGDIICAPLPMREDHTLDVLQKLIFNPFYHFKSALYLLVDHLLRIDTFLVFRVLRGVNLSVLSGFNLLL